MKIACLSSCTALFALIALSTYQPVAAQQLPNLDPVSDAVGSVAGRFRVDETGQANYTIAIATTPGTAGVAPDLSLNYSSQAGDSWLGRGWSVGGQSQISRCRMTREHADPMSTGNYVGAAVSFTRDDVFCLDGQRLLVVSGSYGEPDSEYRPETDRFTRVFARGGNNSADLAVYTGPASFLVQRRDGTESEYGATDDARMLINNCAGASGRACAASSWAINRIEDSSGNFLLYQYAKWNLGVLVQATAPADEQHLREVQYTGKRRLPGQSAPDSAPYARVLFLDEPRAPDHRVTGWQAGSRYALTRRLAGIAVREPFATDVRYYALEHRSAPSDSGQLLLQRIRECSTSAQTLCYPATEFKVDERSYALNVASSVQMSSAVLSQRLDLRIGDIDGDGRQDIVWSTTAASCGGRPAVRVAFGGHSGAGNTSALSLITASTAEFCLLRPSSQIEDSWHLVDYDGDGRDDLLLAGPDNSTWRLHRSLGRPTTSSGAIFSPTDSLVAEVIPVGSSTTALAQLYDFNGDGLLDLLLPGGPSGAQGLVVRLMEIDHAKGVRRFGAPLPVDLRFAVNDKCPQDPNPPPGYIISNCAYTFVRGDPQVRGVDLDGDGRGDLMLKVVRHYSSGATPRPAGPPRFVSPTEFEEIANGSDESTANSISSTHWYFFASAGVQAGTLRFHQYFLGDITALPGGPAPEFSGERGRIHLADVTGDGLADLIYSPVSASTSVRIRVNTGWGFTASQGDITGLSDLDRMQLADLDGDGRADLVYPARLDSGFAYCGLNQVTGSSRPYCVRYAGRQGLLLGDANGLDALAATDGTRPLSDFDGLFADFDGDGQVDSYASPVRVGRATRRR